MADITNPEMLGLERQRAMAELLLKQGLETPQGQMISGRFVGASPWEYIGGLTQQYMANKRLNDVDIQQQALADRVRQQGANEVSDILALAKGREKLPSQELAGPAYKGVAPSIEYPAIQANPDLAMSKALMAQTPQGQRMVDPLLKMTMPEPTPEERRYKAALADGSFKGGFNAFLNQMSEKDKASIAIDRARLGLAQQEQAWNMGMPMGNVGGGAVAPQGQAPLRTINPGSPILAPNQALQGNAPVNAMPPGQMPRFNSKPEQELYLAKQKKINELQAEALNALPGAQLKVETALSAINNMIGDTTVDKNGNIVYGKTKPHAGFVEAVGMPSYTNAFGLTGLFPGSDVQNFKSEFAKVGGSAFLQAVETMRGTGAISEAEGKKATDAITSMSLAQSEKAFVKAANEFRDAVSKGYVASQQKAGVTPFNPTATPGAKTKLVYNPVTGTIE